VDVPPTERRVVVLIVDDSLTIRQEVRTALGAARYEVREAADGVEALERLAGAHGVDVVVCDVNMPRMTGLELLASLRESGIAVPVVMLTTEGQPELIQEARSHGAKGWMVKPFKPELLVKAIDRLAAA
jgi:two-component system chemotaxis response regulator CheY